MKLSFHLEFFQHGFPCADLFDLSSVSPHEPPLLIGSDHIAGEISHLIGDQP